MMNKAEIFAAKVQQARDLAGAVVAEAATDCRDAIEGRRGLATTVRGASAAAFFLGEYGQGVVRDLAGEAGVRKGRELARAALEALDLTPRAVAAVEPAEWDVAIDRNRLPRGLMGIDAKPFRLVG